MRGRPPTPIAIHRLQNTFRADRHGDAPTGEPCLPRCPSHLKGEARKTWSRTGKALVAIRVMTEADWQALSMLCSCWARHIEAEGKIAELGAVVRGVGGGAVTSPWVTISQKAIEQATKLCAELGLTPSARGRVKIVPKQIPLAVACRPRAEIPKFFAPEVAR